MSMESVVADDPQELAVRIWRAFDENLVRLFWEPFWDRLREVVQQTPESAQLRKRSGSLHLSRLAERLGIDNSSLSKKHWGGPKMQVRNLLVPMAVCNISLSEVDFPAPVMAVLSALRSIWGTMEQLTGIEVSEGPPTYEEILIMYFAFNSENLPPVMKVSATHVLNALDNNFAQRVLVEVRAAECERSVGDDVELLKIVEQPRVHGQMGIRRVILTFGDTWSALRNVFPFLVSQQLSANAQQWEASWGFI